MSAAAQLFTERLIKTDTFDEAQKEVACDKVLLGAIYEALAANDLLAPFMSVDESAVPRQLSETSELAWSRAAAAVYLACGGGALLPAELFAFVERVAQLRLEPFGAVFAAALAHAAELDGWTETVAALSGAPLEAARAALANWDDTDANECLLRTALENELAFVQPPDCIDSTHDRTFVRQE